MNVAALLEELQGRGIRVWAEGERLRCNAPADELTAELREQLSERKHDILTFLRSASELGGRQRAIVPLQPEGERTPIFGVAGHNGDVFCYRLLAQHLGREQPFYGLQPPGLDGRSEPLERIEELAGYFAAQVRQSRRGAPCVIAGFCAGGAIAWELARQLQRDGAAVEYVALFGAPYPLRYRRSVLWRERIGEQLRRVAKHADALARLPLAGKREYLVRKMAEHKARIAADAPTDPEPVLRARLRLERATVQALGRYEPAPFPCRLRLFLPNVQWVGSINDPLRWQALAKESELRFGPDECTSDSMLRSPFAPIFAEMVRATPAR